MKAPFIMIRTFLARLTYCKQNIRLHDKKKAKQTSKDAKYYKMTVANDFNIQKRGGCERYYDGKQYLCA